MAETEVLQRNLLRRGTVGDVLRRNSKVYPDKKAIIYYYPDSRIAQYTYKELNSASNRLANALMSLGIKRGDRIAVFSHNCFQYMMCYFAGFKIGVAVVPMNFMLKGKEIGYIINHSESRMFVVEDSLIETVQQVAEKMPSIEYYSSINLTGKPKPNGWLDFDELCSGKYPDVEPEVEIEDEDMATLNYTSGTEALPKGVMTSHKNYYSTTISWILSEMTGTGDNYLSIIPLYHVGGGILQTTFLFTGATSVMSYIPNPAQMLELIHKHKVTVLVLPPALYTAMSQAPGFEKSDLSSMERCLSFGGLIQRPAIETWNREAPHIRWGSYWGQGELSPLGICGMFNKIEDIPNQDLRWIGKPLSTLETKLVDDNDNEVSPGTIGEIVARSPSVMLGYYKNEEKTKETFRNGWHHTGDFAVMDEEGNYYFVDRKKDIVKTGGENVSSYEVEELLFKHPKVANVAIIGLPDPYWGEAVTACIVPLPGMSVEKEEIIQFCKENLAGFKVPKHVFVTDEIPMNPSGKILKRVLREKYKNEV